MSKIGFIGLGRMGGNMARILKAAGQKAPQTAPIMEINPAKHRLEDILTVNFGPNHPSTHGVLRLIVDEFARLQRERVAAFSEYIANVNEGRFPTRSNLVEMDSGLLQQVIREIGQPAS